MRALKLLVVVMGILLVGGSVALVAAVVGRIGRGPAAVGGGAAAPVRATLPPGSRIVSAELSGDRILVRVALREGGEALVLLSARDGAQIAVLGTAAAAAPPP